MSNSKPRAGEWEEKLKAAVLLEEPEREAIKQGAEKYGEYNFDFMEGVFAMKFAVEETLSIALSRQCEEIAGEIEGIERKKQAGYMAYGKTVKMVPKSTTIWNEQEALADGYNQALSDVAQKVRGK